jgi:adenylylsulfate kinase
VWITGLPASGKTTLSKALRGGLEARGYACTLLDGDVLRARLGRSYGHSLEDRFAVLREIVAAARAERDRGLIPIVATISHKREMRAFAREALGRMLEVYLDCAAPVCAARDGKGHYRRAFAGEYDCFVGVTEPYETWSRADLVIDTARSRISVAALRLLAASLAFLGETNSLPDVSGATLRSRAEDVATSQGTHR